MKEILITINHKIKLKGTLEIPNNSTTLVIFAHGDGSNHNSPRNRFVAEELQKSNIGTLLVDLLSEQEQIIDSKNRRHRFDISLISDRLYSITQWIQNNPDTTNLTIGYLGASTGAAAAIIQKFNGWVTFYALQKQVGEPQYSIIRYDKAILMTFFLNSNELLFVSLEPVAELDNNLKRIQGHIMSL